MWRRIRHPSSGLGPGLRSRFSTDFPLLIHALPKSIRHEFVRRHLGPAAAGVMKDRVIGHVPLLLERELVGAAVEGGGVTLTLSKKDGFKDSLHVDHVIAATGFCIDLNRLSILNPSLRAGIAGYRGTPILSRSFESSIPGLYFIGPTAAASFGPMLRFTFGARFAARRVTAALVKPGQASGSKAFTASTSNAQAGSYA